MSARVYLGGLPESISIEDVHKYLSIYGHITEVKLRPGYGFVQFDSEKNAQDVVHTFANRKFLGAEVSVQLARLERRARSQTQSSSYAEVSAGSSPRFDRNKAKYAVVVNGMNPRTCWQELKDFGRLYGGEVAYCDINRADRTQGFLTYATAKDADLAIQKLDGHELHGHVLRLGRHGLRSPDRKRERNERSLSPSRVHDPKDKEARQASRGYAGHSHKKIPSRSDSDWMDRPYYGSESSNSRHDHMGAKVDHDQGVFLRIQGGFDSSTSRSLEKDRDTAWMSTLSDRARLLLPHRQVSATTSEPYL